VKLQLPAPAAMATVASTLRSAVAPIDVDVDDPRREIRIGGAVAGAFLFLFLGWGSIARLDSAVAAPGEVTVYGHRQTVQHRDGGVITAIHVTEAQHVKAGDVLIELAGAESQADEQSLAAQVIALEARRARLQAEQLGQAAIAWPAEYASLTGADLVQARQAQAIQQAQYDAHAAALATQKSVLSQKTSELGELIRGYQSEIASSDRQQKLLGDELKGIQSLAARGFAPLNRVRELQRNQAQIAGQRGQYLASVAQSRQEARETQLEIMQVDKTDGDKIASELSEVETALNDALPKLSAAKDKLAHAQIRAPATGSVVGLSVFTVGGVVQPGQRLMDVVPDKAPLLIEARISPNDAQGLRPGQKAEVRFPSLHDRGLPILNGEVASVSADSLADEKTGTRYFTAEVKVPLAQLSAFERARSPGFELRPGLPAQVLVPLHKRTALQYLLEPFSNALWGSFREQ